MDSIQWRRLSEAVKAFLLSKESREIMVFTIFVLISAGFWLLQTLNETYNMEVRVPLRLQNVPENVVLTTELPSDLRVVLRDKGTNLMSYYSSLDQKYVGVDFSSFDNGGYDGHVILAPSEITKQLTSFLQASTHIVSVRPDTLEFFYNRGLTKRVPVRLKGSIKTDAVHYLSDVVIQPDSVTVWATQSVLDTLQAAYTVVTTISDLSKDVSRKARIAPIRSAKFVPGEVEVTAKVDIYTQKEVEVPIVAINFPADKTLRTFPSQVKISFRVGTKNYKKVTADDFVLALTYEELIEAEDAKLKLRLRSIPEGVSQVRITPESVDYLIEQVEDE